MNFSRFHTSFLIFSIIIIAVLFSIVYLYYGGFARSLSFDGGVRISLRLLPTMNKEGLQQAVTKAGFENVVIRLTEPRTNQWDLELGPEVRDQIAQEIDKKEQKRQQEVQQLKKKGEPIPIELRQSFSVADEVGSKLLPLLNLPRENIVSTETIAASYGEDLVAIALRILIYTIIAISIYLTFRFDFPFAIGASIALLHDLLFALAFIGVARIEPSIPVLAAVLTILGYSINDTIVIFDRIRSNTQERLQATSSSIIDLSVTQTLSRTIVTSLLTLMAVLAILIGGERSLRDFAIVVLFGVLIGTYSSVFVAAPCVFYYKRLREALRR